MLVLRGLKIPNRGLIVVICLLISCAIIVPWFFPQVSNDDKIGWLTLTYSVSEQVYLNGSQIRSTERTDEMAFVTSRNNMEKMLGPQYYYEYPLVMNVSSWEINDGVELRNRNGGTVMSVIVTETSVEGYDCWVCEIGLNNALFYDEITGLLVMVNLTIMQTGSVLYETLIVAQLVEANYEIPGEGYPTQESLFLAGIFIEMAIVVWFVPNYMRKKQHQP